MPSAAPAQRTDSRYCHLCGQLLSGRYYTYDTGLVCCSTCHAARPRCARCNLPLDDRALARSKAHLAGEPALCASCQRSTPRCASCHRHIVATWYTFDELLPPPAVRRFCDHCVKSRPRCDLCRAPISAGTEPLDDGQYRCTLCASEMVLGDGPVQTTYDEALVAFNHVIAPAHPLRQRPRIEVVGRLQMGELRRKYEQAPDDTGAVVSGGYHILGYFVRSRGVSTIYVERGLPRPLLLGTLAHELGHAWQAEHAPGVRDPLLCEGFAEWIAHHALIASGLRAVAARATRRDDLYGKGLRHMLDLERTGGPPAVLSAASGGK
ncbi:MAG TPA: hypothetical protein VKQ30_03885 [Ktedonobacterales bacterium]|nr:hypothetical protein [Ktedonobacterales bacterium]